MRLASPLCAAFLPSLLATGAACNTGNTGSVSCNCPATGVWPLVGIELPCGTVTPPSLSLSGVCSGTGGEQAGQLVFGGHDAGDCHIELSFADGSTHSTDVKFSGGWLACGSDPHGCGQQIYPVGLPRGDNGLAVLAVGTQCVEGGVVVGTSDAAAE